MFSTNPAVPAPLTAARLFGEACLELSQAAARAQCELAAHLKQSAGRLTEAARTATIPEDVFEAALREQEYLAAHFFEGARGHVRDAASFARSQYAVSVRGRSQPCSLLASAKNEQLVQSLETAALAAVDGVERARRKALDPFGIPVPKSA